MAEEKKLHVDEDWKERVQAEKEEAQRKVDAARGEAAASEETPVQTPGGPGQSEGAKTRGIQWPEPSLQLLATSVGSQAMVALGALPHPITKKYEADLGQAKHLIDTLQLLMDKTEGNRTEEETRDIDGMLHELRMAFVAVKQALEAC